MGIIYMLLVLSVLYYFIYHTEMGKKVIEFIVEILNRF